MCDEETKVHIHQEIPDSIKEHLQCKWVSALPGEEPRGSQGNVPRLNLQAEFQTRHHAIYDRFRDMK